MARLDYLPDPRGAHHLAQRNHYEFWFFTYNTGNPIPISANVLRHSLEGRREIPRRGADGSRAHGRMVVIGHSQGGLLARSSVRSLGIVRHVVQEDAVPRMSAQTSIVTSSSRVASS
jgi:hypothetical protein